MISSQTAAQPAVCTSPMLEHIRLMVGYNARLNRQVYEKAALLNWHEFGADRGAYFKSVKGTLNHLMVGDLAWLRRFDAGFGYPSLQALKYFPPFTGLDVILYEDFNTLQGAREQLDTLMVHWCWEDLDSGQIEQELAYTNRLGISSRRNYGELILHMFNHQTHHRGQVSTLLMQFGHDIGVTDFLIDIPENRVDE